MEWDDLKYFLELARTGTLTAAARREAAPERLIVEADVTEPTGAPILSMRAVLRLVPLTEGQGE